MSTFSGTRRWWTARSVIVGITILLSIASSTAVIGLDPATYGATPEPVVVTTAPLQLTASAAPPAESPTAAVRDQACSGYLADYCVEVERPIPTPAERVASCRTGETHVPTGAIEVVSAPLPVPDDALRIQVEVEDGLGIDPECFADEVVDILNDERGWSSIYGVRFATVDDESYDFRLVLASPGTTDSLCYPARTVGLYSCRSGSRVVINLMRWDTGTDEYSGDLDTYRQYLINHEVGHFLGRGHRQCPAPGEPAPVMMQQTKGLGECTPNGWPTENER